MELQIQDLVESIRKEGIEVANEQAERIISEAKKQAAEIVSEAKAAAQVEKDSAIREIDRLKDNAMVSIEQAKRDAMLAFKNEVKTAIEKLLSAEIRNTLSGDALAVLIQKTLVGEDVSQYAAEVQEVTDGLKAALAEEIKNGLEIRPVKGFSAGFRLAAKDGSGFFDCTDEAIMQMLMPFFRDPDL